MALSAKMQFTEQSTRYDDSPGMQKRSARGELPVSKARKKDVPIRVIRKLSEERLRSNVRKYETVAAGKINRIIREADGDRRRHALFARKNKKKTRGEIKGENERTGDRGRKGAGARHRAYVTTRTTADITPLCEVVRNSAQFSPVYRGTAARTTLSQQPPN